MNVGRKAISRRFDASTVRRLLARSIRCLVETGLEWAERRRQRRALLHLSDSMLKDIGLSRADLEREVSKPFWRP